MSLSSSANAAENQYTYTEVRTERIIHKWSIKMFDFLPQEVNESIATPWFYSQDKSERWVLIFYPRGRIDSSAGDVDYVALDLVRDSSGKSSPLTVHTELKISKSGIILKRLSFTYKYSPHDLCGYRQFLERSKLLSGSSADDEFTITCTIDILAEVITSSSDAAIFDSKKNQLSDHFRLLFEDPKFSDFTIIVGDKKFATHKVVLASRSPVFAAMFEHKDLEENRKKEVKIENIEPDVIKGMLEFIYTDQVTNLKTLARGLLEAADKYDLENLRIMCEKTLHEELNKENATEILMLADLHHADTLKKYVMKYIVYHAPELVKSNNWKETGWNLEILLELFDQLALSHAANNEES